MKIRPRVSKLLLNFLIWGLIIGALFFGIFINIFIFSTWSYIQPLIIGIYILLLAALFFAVYKTTYYIFDKNSFIYYCLGKETIFDYEKIRFIEAKNGKDSKTIGIYFSANNVKYFMNDKEGILYTTLIEKCDHLVDDINQR